jgi:hypothetical protein
MAHANAGADALPETSLVVFNSSNVLGAAASFASWLWPAGGTIAQAYPIYSIVGLLGE